MMMTDEDWAPAILHVVRSEGRLLYAASGLVIDLGDEDEIRRHRDLAARMRRRGVPLPTDNMRAAWAAAIRETEH